MGYAILISTIAEMRTGSAGLRVAMHLGQTEDGQPAGKIWVWVGDLTPPELDELRAAARSGAEIMLRATMYWYQADDGAWAPSWRAMALLHRKTPPPSSPGSGSRPGPDRPGPADPRARGEGGARLPPKRDRK